jgi:hypothetical protein
VSGSGYDGTGPPSPRGRFRRPPAERTAGPEELVGGRTVLRPCTVNPRATREDVEAALAKVEQLAATV